MAIPPKNLWFPCLKAVPETALRLFCFPYAGGSITAYRTWASALPPTVELRALQLPGRENRWSETPFGDINELIEAVAPQIAPLLDKPFLFFGHSMGALICFHLTYYLWRHWNRLPRIMSVSAYPAPQVIRRQTPIHDLPDERFLKRIIDLDGTPAEVLANAELLQFMLPTMRADFRICETYRHTPRPPLTCPIVAFGGTEDQEAFEAELQQWQEHTRSTFQLHLFPGGHFFLTEAYPEMLTILFDAYAKL